MGQQRLIVVDIMDTLLHDPWREALEAATGLTSDELNARRNMAVWRALECDKVTEAAYWRNMQDNGISVDPAVFHSVRTRGYRWLAGARELLEELAATQHHVALGTNYPRWVDDVARLFRSYKLPLYASCDLGVRKPSTAYFAHILGDHDLSHDALVLIDDTEANAAAVTELGGTGIVHESAPKTRQQLTKLGVFDG
ncbi:MAG: HAD-IA family hydrolase [Acidobacteriota bacterium]